jgi:hypothetical protein
MRAALFGTTAVLILFAACGDDGEGSTATTMSGGGAVGGGGGGGGTSGSAGEGQGGDGGDGGSGGAPAESGTFVVDGCAGIDGIADRCAWRYEYDARACGPASPCKKAIAFYAGGEQDCSSANYDLILETYAAAGYLAGCMQIFEGAGAAEQEPYADEAPRVDAVLADFVGSRVASTVWSGEHLLLAGVSHGATAPVIAMARSDLDEQPHWHGSVTTAGCFYDGIYDLAALDNLVGGQGGLCAVIHSRIIQRYYGDSASHGCGNGKCPCDPAHTAKPLTDEDTITDIDPAELAVDTWKLIECGSELSACEDLVPGAPIGALCSNIDASPSHTCEPDPMPMSSHVQCSAAGIERCLAWFDQLTE